MDEIAYCATVWAGIRRVERVWCNLPGIDAVLDGVHLLRAESIDGHQIGVLANTDDARANFDNPIILSQLAMLGDALIEARRRETVAT